MFGHGMGGGMRPQRPQMGAGGGQPMSAPGGQYGANANPTGHAWGQQFMQQNGSPPGQMRDQFQAFRQGGQPQQGMGGGMLSGMMGRGMQGMGQGLNQGMQGLQGLGQGMQGMMGQMPPWLMSMLQNRFGGSFGSLG
jgi:hypothetical protein